MTPVASDRVVRPFNRSGIVFRREALQVERGGTCCGISPIISVLGNSRRYKYMTHGPMMGQVILAHGLATTVISWNRSTREAASSYCLRRGLTLAYCSWATRRWGDAPLYG
jgi:hypothetical protein